MRIAVLTYDHPHRKTEDVVSALLRWGLPPGQLTLVLLPWVVRKPRHFLYPHRPGEEGWPCVATQHPLEWGSALGLEVIPNSGDPLTSIRAANPAVVVVGGAGILPAEVVTTFNVLNVHPGFLPQYRGLDALKWAIHEGGPVGVTAHLCAPEADLGRLVLEEEVRPHPKDTFYSFAMRQYEAELALFPRALTQVLHQDRETFPIVDPQGSVPRRRMPREIEAHLLKDWDTRMNFQ